MLINPKNKASFFLLPLPLAIAPKIIARIPNIIVKNIPKKGNVNIPITPKSNPIHPRMTPILL